MKKFYSIFTKYFNFKRKVSLILILLLASFNLFSQSYSPIVVTGFNQDLVANGATTAAASTTTAFDDPSVNGNVFYTEGFNTGPYGLPTNGIISSVSNAGIIYNLADYSSNNSLLLVDLNETETLVLEEPGIYSSISVLAASAQGASVFSVTINYSDNTSEEVTSFNVPDWYYGANYAIKGLGRVSTFDEVFSGNINDPRLYDNTLSVNSSKIITGLTFKKTSSGGRTGIFAICGITPAGVPEETTTYTAETITNESFIATWDVVADATGYRIDVATDNTFKTFVTGYNNLSVSDTFLVVSGLSPETTYYYRVRSENANGQSLNSDITEVETVKNIPGNALDFDGTDDFVDCGNDASLQISGTSITLEAWINPSVFGSDAAQGSIICKHNSLEVGYVLRCGGSGIIEFAFGKNPGWGVASSPANALNLNTWSHVAAVYNGTTIKLYVNGIEVKSVNETANISANTANNLYIGDSETYTTRQFTGEIDEVRIWNTAKSAIEILENMDTPLIGTETGLVAYYNFNETSGTSLADQTSNSNNGTLNNMTNEDWVESYALVYPFSSDIITYNDVSFTFSWDAAETGTVEGYLIDVDDNSDFSSPLTSYDGFNSGTDTSEVITGLNPNTTYYARVRGYKASVGEVGAWSVIKSVTTTKSDQTITFGSLTDKTYGDADFAPGATTSSGLTISYSSSNTDIATIVSGKIHIIGAGTCTIYADQAGNSSYNAASQETQSLTVNKAILTATADNKSKTYGEASPALTIEYTGFVNSDVESVIDTEPTAATTADETSNAGTYDITLTGGTDDNYSFSLNNGTLTVNKAELTATSDDKSKIYGDANPTLTIAYSGFVNSEGETVIDTKPTAASVATETSPAGIYDITASGGSDNNYVFTYNVGDLTVNKATLTATAEDKSKTYGEASPALTIEYTGFVNSDVESVIDTEPTAATTTDETSNAGTYDITLTGGTDDNYSFSLNNGTLTVNKAELTATSNDKSKIYGDANPTLTIAYSGFVNSEGETVIDTKPTAASVATETSPAGTYDITASGGSDNNYVFTYNVGDLTVNKATLTATAEDKSKTYGEASPALTIEYTGFVNSDVESDINTEPTVATAADENSEANTYDITLTGGTDDNYDFKLVTGTLTVNKATLTATAEDKSKTQGEANPEFTIVYTGFANSEDKTVIDTEPTATCSANESSAAGTYDIVLSGGEDNNYSFTYVNSVLTVNASTGIVTIKNEYFKIYPNPVSEKIFVNSTDKINIKTIQVIDLLGKVKISKDVNSYETEIDLNELPQGVYLIQLKSENKTITKRILKK